MSLIEAMAMSLPAILTRVGGNPYVGVEKETCQLVQKESESELAEAMKLMVDNPHLRRQWGKAAHERFHAKFTLDRMLHAYRRMYEEMDNSRTLKNPPPT